MLVKQEESTLKFGEVLSFRKDIFFDGAVQIDWFYDPQKARIVSENFVFHGSEYFGVSDTSGKKLTDTIQFVHDMAAKVSDDQHVNPLTLAIAGYGTGKSHLAVTLAQLLSGAEYDPIVHQKILNNIKRIDREKADKIAETSERANLVLVLNGMKDFNLNYELLKAAQRSLRLYGCSTDNLKKLNRALETAFRFFERNAVKSIHLFEEKAKAYGYSETGENLIGRLREELGEIDTAFDVINAAYNEINGNEIRWDEGVSATAVLETLLSEYCGMSGPFNKIVIIFDEFGRYLEYASATTTARSGDSALQQIFECAQNAEGSIQVINFIQSDIKSYLQRVDQTSNISRYIGRYDASDKYYLSSNLETVFANLIERTDTEAFKTVVAAWQTQHESDWRNVFESMNRWLPTKGIWKEYSSFRQVVVEGIYPLHPIATFMLSQLSDYLQNRSSLMLLGRYVEEFSELELSENNIPFVYPEALLAGDLFTEMLSAEEEGRQYSQHCIRYNNVLRKYSDKLSVNALKILRANLAMRILRCRNDSYEEVKYALSVFSGLEDSCIEEELVWLENEYAILGYDEHTCCFDFLEDSSGAHDFKTFFKRLRTATPFSYSILEDSKIREWANVLSPQGTNFGSNHKIKTHEWQFEQDMFAISELSEAYISSCLSSWRSAVTPDKAKGKIIWLYLNRDSDEGILERACLLSRLLEGSPIVLMLLNDADDRLKNALCDYIAMQAVSESDQQKYGRHFNDKLEQVEENIRSAFDALKKHRLQITQQGAVAFDDRLGIALTKVFENVYAKAVPFDFDGFDSKQPGKARKAFCSISRLLLSGSLSEETVHSFPADVRNRLEASLYSAGAFSWKVINQNYQIIPPEQKAAREVYDEIVNSLPEGGTISLDELITHLVAPPYGMNDYVAVYMVFTVCGNLSYCLRVVTNGAVYSISSWKDLVIQDNKIDLALIRKSTLKRVNVGAVADRFLHLFAQIDNNMDFEAVPDLRNELETLKQAENVPDELTAQYQLALNKLQEGNRVRLNWNNAREKVMSKYDGLLEQRDIYQGLLAIQLVQGMTFYSCFLNTSYAMTEKQQKEVADLKEEIKKLVDPFIKGWISEQRCKGVEYISAYRNHMGRVQKLLSDLGYVSEASFATSRAEAELSNVEIIRARQELKKNCKEFVEENIVTAVIPYTRLLDWQKRASELLEQIEKYSNSLGADAEKLKGALSKRLEEIKTVIVSIKNDMNGIYDGIYEISSFDDVQIMIDRIQRVCQMGISESDLEDFESLKSTLEAFQRDVREMIELQNDRDAFLNGYETLVRKYENEDLDFDVASILEQVASSIIADLDTRDRAWATRFLETIGNKREDLLVWVDSTRTLPRYLSEETRRKYQTIKESVDRKLSMAKIEDVIFSFKKLQKEEQKVCFELLSSILVTPDE